MSTIGLRWQIGVRVTRSTWYARGVEDSHGGSDLKERGSIVIGFGDRNVVAA